MPQHNDKSDVEGTGFKEAVVEHDWQKKQGLRLSWKGGSSLLRSEKYQLPSPADHFDKVYPFLSVFGYKPSLNGGLFLGYVLLIWSCI
jgi:hypothetical protein